MYCGCTIVALLTECVDRNAVLRESGSLVTNVALLTECVDRNIASSIIQCRHIESHSLRSAWIEIQLGLEILIIRWVALLTECVDRNQIRWQGLAAEYSRTPYGVRG